MLVALENLLLLVPFILISQAALIGLHGHLILNMCLAGGVLAFLRMAGMKRFVRELNFPRQALVLGMILCANVTLPVVYRILHENKVGTKPDWGAAYYTNQWIWLGLVPVLCALARLLPHPNRSGTLWPQRYYLPIGFFTLWFVGTGVHLYCLGYVYDFDLARATNSGGLDDGVDIGALFRKYFPDSRPAYDIWLLFLPAAIPLLAFTLQGSFVLFALTILNIVVFMRLVLLRRNQSLALQLLLMTIVFLIADLPASWGAYLTPTLAALKRWVSR